MADDPGLLDDLWGGWREWWKPTSVPAGATYDADTLGMARAQTLGALGGKLLALGAGGLDRTQRASILGSLGDVPQAYQSAIGAGATIRLHDAAARKAEAEFASETASNAMFDKLIAARTTPGGGSSAGPSGNLPTGGAIQQALAALAPAESGGNASAQNAQGYSGRYQIGSSLASDAGVYKPAPGETVADDRGRATNQWRGQWVLPGFEPMSHEQFRANPQAQQAAAEAAMTHNWRQIQAAGLDRFVGKEVGGVQITAPGLLQGAWLGGIKGLQSWLSGQGDPKDSNKTSVSQWAALQPPGGARTMTDAGGGGGDEGSAALPLSPRPKSVADLTPEQLILLRQMPASQRPAKILELTGKAETLITLSPAQSARFGPGTFQLNPTTGAVTKVSDAQTVDIPRSENARYGYGPDASLQRDAGGNVKLIRDSSFRNLTPEELKAESYNPDAIVQAGPDNKRVVIDKGTDPGAALNPENARGHLTRYAPQARAGTLDPNSPEGQRYIAAHRLLSQGDAVEVELPDGRTVRRMVAKDPGFPPLGAPAAPGEDIVTKQTKPLTEGQAKAAVFLGNMEEAEQRIKRVTERGYNPGNTRDNYGQILPGSNLTISKEGQLYRQAQINWYRNKLRWESGASIGDKEAFEEAANFFPRPGDSPENIAQKGEARASAMRNMTVAAGRQGGAEAATAAEAPLSPLTPAALRDIKERVKTGKTSREAALIVLRKHGGLGPEWLED